MTKDVLELQENVFVLKKREEMFSCHSYHSMQKGSARMKHPQSFYVWTTGWTSILEIFMGTFVSVFMVWSMLDLGLIIGWTQWMTSCWFQWGLQHTLTSGHGPDKLFNICLSCKHFYCSKRALPGNEHLPPRNSRPFTFSWNDTLSWKGS